MFKVFHLIQYEEPAEKCVYAMFSHFRTKISYQNIESPVYIELLYGNRIIEHTIQYDRNKAYSAEKSVLGQTIQNSF